MAFVAIDYPLYLVDVEGLVSSGAPRSAFTLVEHQRGQPLVWRLDVEALRDLGWTVTHDSLTPPPSGELDRDFPNHPYALGPAWKGVNTWHATFTTVAGPVHAIVAHELRMDDDRWPTRPPTSPGPWRWRVDGPSISAHHGTADSPILAAAAVEALLTEAGVDVGERTMTRRSGSTGQPVP